MKNILTLRKESKIDWQSIIQIPVGILSGMAIHPYIIPVVLLYFYYVKKQGFFSFLYFLFSITITRIYLKDSTALYIVCSAILFLLVHFFCEKHIENSKGYQILCNAILLLFFSWFYYGFTLMTLYYLLGGSLLFYVFDKEVNHYSVILWFLIASSIYLLSIEYFLQYKLYFIIVYAIFISFLFSYTLTFYTNVFLVLEGLNPYYAFYFLILNRSKEKRFIIALCSWISIFYDFSFYTILFCVLCTMGGLLTYKEMDRFMVESNIIEKQHQKYMEHSFYKQIHCFSNVFYNLSKYYENNKEVSELLKRMGEAIEYSSKLSKQYIHVKSELEERISELLKGYHFSLLQCSVKKEEEKLQIYLELAHLYNQEVEEVILPLLEKTTETKLRISNKEANLFVKGKYKLWIESREYPQISIYKGGLAIKEVSGDTPHVFVNESYTVLMLSDGMGSGKEANKISKLLIQIMESLMHCEIPQNECISMMNMFLRSDLYATLDVLSIDRKTSKAYLLKAASAPTYLIRNNTLYALSAHSLPIGIVDEIKADVYEITFEKGDLFLMCSDGIEKREIEKWLNLRRCTAIKNEGLNFMNIIKETDRKDDSTFIMAKIN